MDQHEPALHRAIVVVDVERFGDPVRTNTHQLLVREGLYRALEEAFAEAGVAWAACTTEDRGDGVLILVPPEVPKIRLVDQLPHRLAVALRRYNAGRSTESRIRLRVAVHAGEIHRDPRGVAGHALNFGFRLLDAPVLRMVLSASTEVLALIVSDWFYREVVRHDPATEPGWYRQVQVTVKETDTTAWVRLPTELPTPAAVLGGKETDRPAALPAPSRSNLDAAEEIHQRLAATESRPLDVIAVSAHNVDNIHQVDLIAPDHEASVEEPKPHAGGSGANTVSALALLGLRCAAVGVVADDHDGLVLFEALRKASVDTSMILVRPSGDSSRTGRTLVFTDANGRRLIYVYPGVNELLAQELVTRGQRDTAIRALAHTRLVHLTSFTGGAERKLQEDMAAVLDPDTILSFTPGSLYARLGADRLGKILGRANLLFVYEHQLDQMLANSSAAKHARPDAPLTDKLENLFNWKRRKGFTEPLVVMVKKPAELSRGGQPSEYLNLGCGRETLEEFIRAEHCAVGGKRRDITDSTGAGDALAAGLILGLVRGRPLHECADTAFVLAMSASSALGARTQLPTLDQLGDRWAMYLSRYSAPAWLSPTGAASPLPGPQES